MFKKMIVNIAEPICLCSEQKLSWTVEQTKEGPSLLAWCLMCGTKLQVPNREFKAVFQFDKPYPGKVRIEKAQPTDYSEYMKRRRPGPPS